MKKKRISDITMILVAILLGLLADTTIGKPAIYIGFIRDTWLDLMKVFLVPIIACILVKGISSMDGPKALGRIEIKIIVFYVFTTICTGVSGIGITNILNPDNGFSYEVTTEGIVVNEMLTIVEFSKSMFFSNISATFPSGDTIQAVIISYIIGVVIVLLPEDKREPARDWFVAMNDLVISTINIALKLTPTGVLCFMVSSLRKYGVGLLVTTGKILGTFYLCCMLHLIVVYRLLPRAFTGISSVTFIRKAFNTFATAASTCSNNAVIPVSVEVATQNSGCNESVVSLGIPLGATVSKGDVAILRGIIFIFSGQVMGIPLTITQIINILFITTLATSAGSGAPGGGLMDLMIVGTAVGMSLDIVLMVEGFYRFFDMGTTSMNCLGDMSAAVIVDRLEKHRAAELEKKLQRWKREFMNAQNNGKTLSCVDCGSLSCRKGNRKCLDFCLTQDVTQEEVAELEKLYMDDNKNHGVVVAGTQIESEYLGIYTRVEGIMEFAKQIGARKIGVVTCSGLTEESRILAKISKFNGFDVYSVIYKVGSKNKTSIGLEEEYTKAGPAVCDPILQARKSNEVGTELNVVVGLCVGHDSLFYKYAEALTTTLITKDRVLGHGPATTLYQIASYYKGLLEKPVME